MDGRCGAGVRADGMMSSSDNAGPTALIKVYLCFSALGRGLILGVHKKMLLEQTHKSETKNERRKTG